MGDEILVYAFLNPRDGTEGEFQTLDFDIAFEYATANRLKIIGRRYEYKDGQEFKNSHEAYEWSQANSTDTGTSTKGKKRGTRLRQTRRDEEDRG